MRWIMQDGIKNSPINDQGSNLGNIDCRSKNLIMP